MCLLVIRLMHYQQLMMRVRFARLQLAHRIRYIPVIRLVVALLANSRSSNVNGLRGKALQIQELICPHHPDIILHQETKLDASVSSSEIFPTDFTVIQKDRTCHGVPSTGQPAADVVLYGPVRFPAERLDYSGIGCPPTLCDAGA